jgi:glycosyltransferase A (GT-A) superfamily protein (DUF2064 family)
MIKINLNKKRAVIFFVRNEKRLNQKKFKDFNTYRLFNKRIEDVASEAKQKIPFDLVLCSDKENIIHQDTFVKQRGENFGEKFNNAISDTFNLGYSEVIIIGNDSPDISANHIVESFNYISKSVVIGPSYDGGFYLLGLTKSKFSKNISARWNTSYVLNDILTFFTNKDIHQLNCLMDIDSVADLVNWLLFKNKISVIFEKQLVYTYKLQKKEIYNINLNATEQNINRIQTQKAPPQLYYI